jgi:hypothetical protein
MDSGIPFAFASLALASDGQGARIASREKAPFVLFLVKKKCPTGQWARRPVETHPCLLLTPCLFLFVFIIFIWEKSAHKTQK